MTGASLYIAAAIYFVLFGTGEIQDWNFVEEEEEDIPSTNSDSTITMPKTPTNNNVRI